MNFGGIIAGALGGGAQAAGEIADANLKEQAAMRSEQRSLALNMEKFKQEADYKLAQKRADEERIQGQRERVFDRADSNMRGKDATMIGAVGAQVQGESPVMSSEEIAELAKDSNIRAIWEKNNLVPKRTQSGVILARMDAASQIGADPEIRKDLQTQYTSVSSAEREATRQAQQDRRLDQADDREARRAAEAAARLDLDRARFEALQSGGSKLTKAESINLNTTIATQRKGINELKKERDQIKLMGGDQSRLKEIDDEIEVSNSIIKSANQLLQTSLDGRATVPPPAPSPAPAPRPGAAAPAAGGKVSLKSTPEEMDKISIWRGQLEEANKALASATLDSERNRARENIRQLNALIDETLRKSGQTNDNRASAPGARTPIEAFLKR